MNRLDPMVVKCIVERIDSQTSLSNEFESNQQREMAFLAAWAALESTVKTVCSEYRRSKLLLIMDDWKAYLADLQNIKRPTIPEKSSFSLELNFLPEKREFIGALEYFGLPSDTIWALMDSEGKYRERRNKIAHSAAPFSKESTYREYLDETRKVIASLRERLETQLG